MDAFFAAVEVLDNPALKGKPVIVGGTPEGRGVVSTASYEARRYGVHSAMPAAKAVRLCPHGVFLRGNFGRYAAVSRQVMAILRDFTPVVEPLSCDEAFLDVTECRRLFGDGEQIARKIRRRVADEVGLTCSVGVAHNKFLAKLASDLQKPDGLTVVPADARAFLAPLPVGRIWGIGPKSQERLEKLGIKTIGELADYPPDALRRRLGDHAADLQALARGEDRRVVEVDHQRKSVGREETFAKFLEHREQIEKALLDLCEDVATRLRKRGEQARTLTLKVRNAQFHTVTRATRLRRPTDLTDDLYAAAVSLFRNKVDLAGQRVRLLGISTSGLNSGGGEQLELFEKTDTDKRHRVAEAVDRLRGKLGRDAVRRGRLVDSNDPEEAK
jgi:DNA polymerase-4